MTAPPASRTSAATSEISGASLAMATSPASSPRASAIGASLPRARFVGDFFAAPLLEVFREAMRQVYTGAVFQADRASTDPRAASARAAAHARARDCRQESIAILFELLLAHPVDLEQPVGRARPLRRHGLQRPITEHHIGGDLPFVRQPFAQRAQPIET